MFLTLLRISVLSRSFMSMLKASSFNCGPSLQEIVMHALPGRSQSFFKKKKKQGKRRKREWGGECVGERNMGNEQMLHSGRKMKQIILKGGEVFLPKLCVLIWWRKQIWSGRCSPCPGGWCTAWGSCEVCSCLDRRPPETQDKSELCQPNK